MRWIVLLVVLLVLGLCLIAFRRQLPGVYAAAVIKLRGARTVAQRVEQYGKRARARIEPYFATNNVPYPPGRVILVGLKQEKELEVWASGEGRQPRFIGMYPIAAASGQLGPKLREGDLQVPEGIYRIESLNPNSLYHLSLRVDYPNEYDLAKAKLEGRDKPGTDIMIHGGHLSIGCLAMGDDAIEELFVLAAETGIENIKLIISPVDFRVRDLPADMPKVPAWTAELYEEIKRELNRLQ